MSQISISLGIWFGTSMGEYARFPGLARWRVRQNHISGACKASGSQPLNTIAFLAEKSGQLAGSQPWGTNLLRDYPAFRRQPQRVGPLLISRRNSRSSTGAPLSRIIATVTPSEGEFGAVRISFPSIAA